MLWVLYNTAEAAPSHLSRVSVFRVPGETSAGVSRHLVTSYKRHKPIYRPTSTLPSYFQYRAMLAGPISSPAPTPQLRPHLCGAPTSHRVSPTPNGNIFRVLKCQWTNTVKRARASWHQERYCPYQLWGSVSSENVSAPEICAGGWGGEGTQKQGCVVNQDSLAIHFPTTPLISLELTAANHSSGPQSPLLACHL